MSKTAEQRKYEMMMIFSPELVEKKRESALAMVKKTLEENGGKVEKEEHMGMRDIAYSIKKHNRGYYYVCHFRQNPEAITEIDRTFRLENDILRHFFASVEDDAELMLYPEEEASEEKPARASRKSTNSEQRTTSKKTEKAEKKEEAAPKAKKEEKLDDDVEEKLSKIIDSDITL